MKKIETSLKEFLDTVTNDFKDLIQRVLLMKTNMDQIKREGTRLTNELQLYRDRHEKYNQDKKSNSGSNSDEE